MFRTDRPLTDPTEDRLGRTAFADMLAKSVMRCASSEGGVVIGVQGPWGSGKSTVLNFLQNSLPEHAPGQPIQIVRFNPWWFAPSADLAVEFLTQLKAAVLPGSGDLDRIRSTIGSLGNALSTVPEPELSGLGQIFRRFPPKRRALNDLKRELEKDLRAVATIYVVLVDDVDRLGVAEIQQLFRLIKGVADLPYVVFVLTFDPDVVSRALDQDASDSGRSYLSKIVQIPLDLPAPDEFSVQTLFLDRLAVLLEALDNRGVDHERWVELFHAGIRPLIREPRHAIRLANVTEAALHAIGSDVDTVDLVGYETLRLFFPSIVKALRTDEGLFLGRRAVIDKDWKVAADAFFQAQLAELSVHEQDVARELLQALFPKLRALWSNHHYDSDIPPEWRDQGRIAHPDRLPFFLAMRVPTGNYGLRQILEFFDTQHSSAITTKLSELIDTRRPDGRRHMTAFLGALSDANAESIPSALALKAFPAVAEISDAYVVAAEEERQPLEMPVLWLLNSVLLRLFQAADVSDRAHLLRAAAEKVVQYGTLVHFVQFLSPDLEADPDAERVASRDALVDPDVVAAARMTLLGRIREQAKAGELMGPLLGERLGAWEEWAGIEEVRMWCTSVAEDGARFGDLLALLAVTSKSAPMEGGLVVSERSPNPGLMRFLGRDVARTAAEKLLEASGQPNDVRGLATSLLTHLARTETT